MTPTKAPQKEETKAAPSAQDAQKAVQEGAEKAAKAIDHVFAKLKTHFETKKVDEWQKKWLAVPANRKKYEKLADAPEVVGEELVALTNDIIDFVQGQGAGQSNLLKKLKGKFQAFFRHPAEAVKKESSSTKENEVKPKNGNGKMKKTEAKPAKK